MMIAPLIRALIVRFAGDKTPTAISEKNVSVTNGCRYCIASHGAAARKKGMTPEQHAELVAIIGLANETNRHAVALDLQIDDKFR